jgi:DNA-binding transcriptional ArsR family regulator
MRTPPHPGRDQIELAPLLEALSDPTRLAILLDLADGSAETEARCSAFLHLGSKTNLTYHLAKMRHAGITRVRVEGTSRYISLRRDDLEARFPGLLDTLIASARRNKRARRAIG